MREITDHIANPANEALTIQVMDEPGQGGACHEYSVRAHWDSMKHVPLDRVNGLIADPKGGVSGLLCLVSFQNGPIQEFGVNGITQEALLAIVIDRLRSFQAGPFSCRENVIALTHCEDALMWLQKRTRDRLRRGVEGTNQR